VLNKAISKGQAPKLKPTGLKDAANKLQKIKFPKKQ
jgi:hypothetical protein